MTFVISKQENFHWQYWKKEVRIETSKTGKEANVWKQ